MFWRCIFIYYLNFFFQTFILQLEGKTKWKLFKPMQELPQEASPDLELSDIGEPIHEFDMKVYTQNHCCPANNRGPCYSVCSVPDKKWNSVGRESNSYGFSLVLFFFYFSKKVPRGHTHSSQGKSLAHGS